MDEAEKVKCTKAQQTLASRLNILEIAVKGGWNAGNKEHLKNNIICN